MINTLAEILIHKRKEIGLKSGLIHDSIDENIMPSFLKTLQQNRFSLITEVKTRSPSGHKSSISSRKIIAEYIKLSVPAISILTDAKYFGGSIDDIKTARTLCSTIPILQKDFIISKSQIVESKAIGASAILLIIKSFKGNYQEFLDLYSFAEQINIEVLVEVENELEIDIAMRINPKIIGVNSRNLETLAIDTSKFETLLPKIPDDIYKIALSGIKSGNDIVKIKNLCNAAVIGSSICESEIENISSKIQEFMAAI